jgi:protein-S-isoprenylcysteine O-methyltransferase Ste14
MRAPDPEPTDAPAVGPPSHFPWPPVLFLTALVAGWLLQRTWPLAWPGMNDMPAKIIGWGFILVGFGIAAWALYTFWRSDAEIRPHAEATVLVTTGPYRRFRNPMYIGYVLILLGLADTVQNLWIVIMAAVFAVLVTWLAILPEERHLEARFGEAWREYKARSRRWL